MFERFTDQSRRIVVLASEEARTLNHERIGPEHILLALTHDRTSSSVTVLEALGVEIDKLREDVDSAIGTGAGRSPGHIPFTPSAKKVLEFALREALILSHNEVRPEHILLGLLREDNGTATRLLSEHGVTPAKARNTIQQLTGFRPEPAPAVFTGYLAVKQTGTDYSFDLRGLHLTREACEADAPEGATVRRVRISIENEPATHALTA